MLLAMAVRRWHWAGLQLQHQASVTRYIPASVRGLRTVMQESAMVEAVAAVAAVDSLMAVEAITEGHKWLVYRPRACGVASSEAHGVHMERPCGATAGGRRRSVRSAVNRSYNGSARRKGRRDLAITTVSFGIGTCTSCKQVRVMNTPLHPTFI